jgi:pimeloyl-ACP methyl ester carboxylesterase
MRKPGFLALTLAVLSVAALAGPVACASPRSPLEGFVEVNSVRLQYLDWGGSGPALILIHGLGDNPHTFDDLAPAFADRFHVIAYARRGSGGSEVQAPYDVVTLTQDLRGLMDALRIAKADLVGYSAGGGEITELAAASPDRVGRIVYLDAAYDGADPAFQAVVSGLPVGFFDPPSSAMASLDAYRSYLRATLYPGLDDMRRIEANLRQKVVIQPDGTLKYRTPREVVDTLYSTLQTDKRRDYARVHCPVLAIYAESLYDTHVTDAQRRSEIVAYEQKYWKPFQSKSIEQLRRELPSAEIVRVPGSHESFCLTARQEVVSTMLRFLTTFPHVGAK